MSAGCPAEAGNYIAFASLSAILIIQNGFYFERSGNMGFFYRIINDGYDYDEYDKEGYNRKGFDQKGFDRDGYDQNGFNWFGFDREGNSILAAEHQRRGLLAQ